MRFHVVKDYRAWRDKAEHAVLTSAWSPPPPTSSSLSYARTHLPSSSSRSCTARVIGSAVFTAQRFGHPQPCIDMQQHLALCSHIYVRIVQYEYTFAFVTSLLLVPPSHQTVRHIVWRCGFCFSPSTYRSIPAHSANSSGSLRAPTHRPSRTDSLDPSAILPASSHTCAR